MSGKTFKIVNTLDKRLKLGAANLASTNFATSGIVFGFNNAAQPNESFCLGCVATEEDVPFATIVLGAFFLGESIEESRITELCSSLAKSKKSGKLVVLQYWSESQVSCYDIKSKSLCESTSQIVTSEEALAGLVNVSLNSTFHLKCTYYSEKFKDNVQAAIEDLKQKVATASFQLSGSAFKLSNKSADMLVEDLYGQIEQFDELADVQIPANMKKKMVEKLQRKLKSDKETVEFNYAGGGDTGPAVNVPLELKEGACIELNLPVRICYAVQLTNQTSYLHKTFTTSLGRVLGQLESALLENIQGNTLLAVPQVYSFYDASTYCHPITVVFSDTHNEEQFKKQREQVHLKYIIPLDKPTFKTTNQVGARVTKDTSLANVHTGLSSGIKNGEPVTVSGKYLYFHYNQNNKNDAGWGCAYRSLQTIISWFQLQGYLNIDCVPSHQQIQQALVDVGDKPASFVGSSKWIGSQEVCYVLSQLYQIDSKIIFVSSGAELANKGRELIQHFQTNGSPIMIGGGVLAHTIIGVHFDETNGDIKFLVLDPHFTGDDDLSVIHKKGWCGWKSLSFWDKNSFYNLCLPQKPKTF